MTAILGPCPCQGCGRMVEWWRGLGWREDGLRHVCDRGTGYTGRVEYSDAITHNAQRPRSGCTPVSGALAFRSTDGNA